MDSLLQDLRTGVRSLRKSPGFAIAAVVTLALGIGANTAIFSVVDRVLLRPLPFPESERLVRVFTSIAEGDAQGSVSGPDFLDLRDQRLLFEHVAAHRDEPVSLQGTSGPERLDATLVSEEFFSVLGQRAAAGRLFVPGDVEGNEVVLSHGLWQRRFGGDRSVVGRTLILSGQPHTVVGVLAEGEAYPTGVDVWVRSTSAIPRSPFAADLTRERGARYLSIIARTARGVAPARLDAGLRTLSHRLGQEFPESNRARVFSTVPLREFIIGDARRPLLVLLGAVGVVLLIACANIANLLLTRGAARQQEVAVRAALGAPRRRLVRQFLVESLVLAAIGGAFGALLATWGLHPLLALGPENNLFANVSVDARVLVFSLVLSILTGIVFGVLPALQSTRTDLSGTLRQGGRSGTGTVRPALRTALVASQFALSLVLLIGAGLLLQSFWRLSSTDPGFRTERVISGSIALPQTEYTEGAKQSAFFQQLLERVRVIPGVQSAGAVFPAPFSGNQGSATIGIEGRQRAPDDVLPIANITWATPGFFQTVGLPLLRGRAIDDRDREGAPEVIVINQAMAKRFWPNEDPVGKRLRIGGDTEELAWQTIVGVVADSRPYRLEAEPMPEMYLPHLQNPWPGMSLMIRTASDPASVVSAVRAELAKLDADLPLAEVRTFDELVSASVAGPRFRTVLLGIFAALALLLAAVGIYAVIAFIVTQRTREIGIRVALGADANAILRMVLRQGMVAVVLGSTIGLIGALAGARVLSSMLYGVTAWDPLTFIAVPVLLVLVALFASWLPARRAMRVDPVVALRAE